MSQPTWRFALAALLVAWSVDLLFWQTPPGVSFLLWTAIALAAGLLLLRGERARLSPWSGVLILSSLVFSAITFLRTETFTQFLGYTLTLFSLALLAATLLNGNWVAYRLWDYVLAGLRLAVGTLIRPFELLRPPAARPASIDPGAPPSTRAHPYWRKAGGVLTGLLLALPVVAVLGSLLASADPIFSDRLSELLKIFDLSRLGEYIFRLVYILVLAFIFCGVYLHAARPAAPEPRPDSAKALLNPFLGWTEAAVVLVCVDLLFALFVGIQFWYFFGGEANITATQYTYADYARRGFFELVTVALISLALYLGLSTITRRATRFTRTGFTVLSVFLLAMVLVMLVSAYQRLSLYESAYGFTHLRLYTHVFIVWLGILLLATVAFELTRRSRHMGLALLITLLGFGLTFGLLNVDATIAAQNLARARAGSSLDTAYLTSLSADGVPTLLDEYRRPDQSPAVRDALGAELACRLYIVNQNPMPSWLSFNVAYNNGRNLLLLNQAEWSAYPVTLSPTQGPTVTVNSADRPCNIRTSLMD